ncbi:MAG TPA: AAA family ATPase [Gaiellaceae bacterium]|nr:AAA family ATPase [Gaiellaceae bacterium]
MQGSVVGRAAELAAIDALLSGQRPGVGAIVLEGEPGIGKTTVWEEGVAAAAERGYHVLACRPAESEATLPFAALGDLLEHALSEVLAGLPAPQARSLEVALQLVEPEEPADRLAVHRGTLGVLRILVSAQPVLLAIDDMQWIDPTSAAAIGFALRRLSSSRVRVLGCLRRPHADVLELSTALPPGRLEQLGIGPLDENTLHGVVSRRLGVAVPRPTMTRVHQISGGNPFYAVELVRSLPTRNGRIEATSLELPRTLLDLVQARLRALPPHTVEILAAAGAMGDADLAILEALDGDAAGALQPAEEAGIVHLEGKRVRFEHPLLASGSLALLTESQRRRLHRRLADAVHDLEQRALHLALGWESPAEETAALLERAAQAAADRGAPQAAGELAEHAARLTPDERVDDAHRRLRLAAAHFLLAGETSRGRDLLGRLEQELPPGPERATVLILYADTHLEMPEAIRVCAQARAEAVGDDRCLAEAHRLSSEFAMLDGRLSEALDLAREATRIAERAGDPVLLVRCVGTQSHFETYTGEITAGLLEQAVSLEEKTPGTSAHYSPAQILGLRLMYSDRLDEARPLLERILQQAEDRGDELEARNLGVHLAQLELRAGRWALAHRYSDEGYVAASQLGIHSDSQLFVRALVAAHLGRVDEAREAAASLLAPGVQPAYALWVLLTRWALGFLELSLGNARAADAHLTPLPHLFADVGYQHPGVRPILPDAIEAMIGVGKLEEAARWTEELGRRGTRLDNPWAIATAGRCAALISAAAGDLVSAHAGLQDALAAHARSTNPFERARTLLVLGVVERRLKRRRAARETLGQALDLFDTLGAPLWAEKAAAELARIPGRTPAAGELSETQFQIGRLVAQGLSNKEVAARLFITVRTVESNLSKIYATLGIRSRTELAGRL